MKSKYWFFSSIFLFFLVTSGKSGYFPELQKVVDTYEYDPECVFNYTQVNSQTIKKFPQCDIVYAILVVNNATNLTEDKLLAGFGKVKHLKGGLRIENTNLQSISIFTKYPTSSEYLRLSVAAYGIHIRNNSELTDVSMLHKMWAYMENNSESEFRVEYNAKLDAKFMCDFGYMHMYTEVITRGNLRDCACPGGLITSSSASQYSTCESVFNGLKLYNINETTDLSPLLSVEYIRGVIDIQNTTLQNLSFLSNVGDFKVNNNGANQKIVLNLQNNTQMTRFGMPMLMEIQNVWSTGIKLANFEHLHENFCLTIEEMAFFLENQVSFLNLHAKICADNRTTINENLICHFESMSKLPEGCNIIMGDLIINPGDEPHALKLENVRYLFGSVYIQNTTLEDMVFYNLRYIVQLNDSHPVIQIVGNRNLTSAFFRDLENLVTRKNRNVVIQNNNKDLFKSESGNCTIFQKDDWSKRKILTNLTIAGGDCGASVQIDYRFTSMATGLEALTMISLVLISNFL